MSFIYGLMLGFFSGLYLMWFYMKDIKPRPIRHITIKMTAEEAMDFKDSKELFDAIKKEMDL